MKLVMTLLVRDEADLISDQIRYHRAQGVDHFLVLDHRSVDSTPQQLQAFAAAGDVSLYQTQAFWMNQGPWVTQLARLAFVEHQADWVINNDADEFWWSDQGSLKEVLAQVPESYRLVRVRRHNFVTLSDYTSPFWQSLLYRQQVSQNFLGQPLSDKVCHRGEADIVVHPGNHSVSPLQAEDIWPQEPIEIFHFPVRDAEQFERKVRHGGAAWFSNPAVPQGMANSLRYLYEQYLIGKLPAVFEQWCYTPERLQATLDASVLVQDRRLQQFMRLLPPDSTV